MKILRHRANRLPETIAAIDLGSNSFHMIIAKHDGGVLNVIDQLKESVRLRAGLDKDDNLSEEAENRAMECLARFGQRLKEIPPLGVRIVGTNTLRRITNSQSFLAKAEQLLGHRIEIISGEEEARLIYQGVAHHVVEDNGRRMVVDIGGGSTEVTLGDRFDAFFTNSFEMGSVMMTQIQFADGKLTSKRFKQAKLIAEMELEPYIERYKRLKWVDVIGASGAVKSVGSVVTKMGWSESGITAESMDKLIETMVRAGHTDALKLSGLKDDRKPVFAGGAIILKAIFDAFSIKRMSVSEGALREGILYDMIGREQDEDTRSRTIQSRAKRYNVDHKHAEVVKDTAMDLYSQVAADWKIDDDECERQLAWAAMVHEAGMIISHNQSHKHSEYIIRNSDLPGFSSDDQKVLATLVRVQRNSFSDNHFAELNKDWREKTRKIGMLLRLAVLLNRGRHEKTPVLPWISVSGNNVILEFPENFLEQHPLTTADLEKERSLLAVANISLELCTTSELKWTP